MQRPIALLLALVLLFTLAGCAASQGADPTRTETGTAEAAPETAGTLPSETAAETASAPERSAPITEVPGTEAPETEAFSTEAPVTEAPEPETAETEAPETELAATPAGYAPPEDPWSLIGEALFEQGSYTDDCGNYYDYSYDLPCLLADTPGAREINAAIDADFGQGVRDELKNMEGEFSLILYHAGFRGELWEDVLTLVVIGNLEWGMDVYGVYCYDLSTGLRLTTPELLEKMGVSEEDFLQTCRERFRACFLDMYGGVADNLQDKSDYERALESVDSDLYVNLDLKIYPDATGDIVVVAPIASVAGAAYYEQELHLGIGGNG